MSQREALFEIRNLKAYYRTEAGPVRAVDDVSFILRKNEIFGLAGESGCGKSTLALAMLRLARPPCYVEGGEVLLEGKDLLKLDDESLRQMRWTRISYIPQSSMNTLNPVMKIRDQIVDVIKAHTAARVKEARNRAAELFEMVALPNEALNMYPHELSGGMRQRAVIAMAVALKPSLIVADEPTTALDVNVQRVVLQSLSSLKESLGASLIIVTHDMAAQAEIVDKLAIMYAGKIVEMGDVHSLYKQPFHPYTRGLMQAIPTIEERRKPISIPGVPPNLLKPPQGCRFHPRCPESEERCSTEEPAMREVKPSRWVACHRDHG